MQSFSFRRTALLSLLALALLAAPAAEAMTVLKMDLGELCHNSGLIIRGRVLSADMGSVEVGGATMPTVTYSIDVSDTLMGEESSFIVKGDQRIAQITMLANKAATSVDGDIVRFSKLPAMPNLEIGQEYLLITTRPSSVGLSAPVGLGQGCFHIDREEIAANELGNAGLSPTIDGPVTYSQLADEIRSLIGQ